MSIKDNMEKLQNKLKQDLKDIKNLEDLCEHKQTRVGFELTNSFNASIRVICKDCQKTLGFPTQEEIKTFTIK